MRLTQPWPMGDRPDTAPMPPGIDEAKLDAAVDAAFADPAALTAAFLVLYKGRIVAERYMPGITRDTQLESWSMGKSITATLFGLLVKDGTYTLEQPAPVPLWQSPDDPRAKIRIIDLLQDERGLRSSRTRIPTTHRTRAIPITSTFTPARSMRSTTRSTGRLQFPPEHRRPLPELRSADDRLSDQAGRAEARRRNT